MPVPYVASWSTETPAVWDALTVRADGNGLAYRDERPADRDNHGVLWARISEAPGTGRPDFRAMHPVRQRRALRNLLCQVCGGPADRTSQGWLFLMDSADQTPGWPEGALVTKPPICRPCVTLALRHCPALAAPVALRSRKPRVWGVYGDFYLPTRDGHLTPVPTCDHVPYGRPAARWFLASQLVVELTRCTRAELDIS